MTVAIGSRRLLSRALYWPFFAVVVSGCSAGEAPTEPEDAAVDGAIDGEEVEFDATDLGSDAARTETDPADTAFLDVGTADVDPDVGSLDTASGDTSAVDTGSTDTGSTDTGSTDTGSTDTSSTDTGSTDTGSDTRTDTGALGDVTADGPADVGTCVTTMGPTGLRTGVKITAKGKVRTYVISVPATASATAKLPVVFVWHGDGGTGSGVRGSLGLEAPAAGGAIFVYPDGVSMPYGWWDIESTGATNQDVALFDGILASLKTQYCIDSTRIFSTGFSRGGFFTNYLACERGNVLRAIAPQSGGGPYWPGTAYNGDGKLVCPTPPVAALVIHGNADTVVANKAKPPEGGWQAFYHWAYWNHATPRTGLTYAADPYLPSPCLKAKDLPATRPVIQCFIAGLGHSPWTLQASTVWTFFSSFR